MKVEKPTSRDIAEAAGVSHATVSRALRNSPLVRAETRERIQKIARDLDYFVNRNAGSLRTHQSNTIALLGTTSQRSPELAARDDGYCRALREAGVEPDDHLRVDADSSYGQGYRAVRDPVERKVEFDRLLTDVGTSQN